MMISEPVREEGDRLAYVEVVVVHSKRIDHDLGRLEPAHEEDEFTEDIAGQGQDLEPVLKRIV